MEKPKVRSRYRVCVWFAKLKWLILQIIAAVTLIAVLLLMSVFLYATIYHLYMPVVSHEWPIHLRFRTDCEADHLKCSFPSSNVSMMSSSDKTVLVHGQAYVVKFEMEMPESVVNQNLGMFMVQVQFYTRHGEVVFTSARSTMLHFKSFIHWTMETIFFLPSLIYRSFSQKQTVSVELSDNYLEDPYRPTVGAVIEVQNRKAEIYTAVLKIHAQFSGLRYFLYYWSIISAIIGIGSIFTFLLFIALFSYLAYLARSSGDLQKTTDTSTSSNNEHYVEKNAASEYSTNSVEVSAKSKEFSPTNSKRPGIESLSPSDKLCSTGEISNANAALRKRIL